VTRSWTLRQRVTALCVVVGSVLALLAGAATVVANQNRSHLNNLLVKSGPLRADAQSLLAALVDQETGVRGYALTGKDVDLAPYRNGIEKERRLIAAMDALLEDDSAVRRQLRAVQNQAQQWRFSVAQPVIAATTKRGTAAGQALLTDETRQRFDSLRASVDALQRSILDLRNDVAADARRTGNTLVLLLVVAGVVVVLAGALLVVSLNRLVISPVTHLAEQVRDVASGNYLRDIEGVGPPELAQLANHVDAMRRKIAADLAEVREARSRIELVNGQLERQAEDLVRSNRDLEQFAYVASHDLQEPLRKVASFCQLLQRRYAGQLDERADQYIAFAVDGAQRMQRLINDLLAFSRIGRLTSGFAEVDLNRIMDEVATQIEAARRYADGTVTWSQLPVVNGEEALLTNLLVNLVGNSLKFRRPEVPPRVHVSARRIGDEWEITCQDNGIGIEPEFADKIFVIFQRLHSKDAYPGTGIGLAIAKKIVEYHGGRVWVDADVSEGTAIRFTLPVLETDEGDREPTEHEPTESTAAGPAEPIEGGPAGAEAAAEVADDATEQSPKQADGMKETVV
jgi:signal transduction histidine kinase